MRTFMGDSPLLEWFGTRRSGASGIFRPKQSLGRSATCFLDLCCDAITGFARQAAPALPSPKIPTNSSNTSPAFGVSPL